MKQLQPAPLKDKYWREIAKLIEHIFFDSVYRDLFDLTKKEQELYNFKDPLSRAILSSRVGFDGGVFFGKFSSSITKQLRGIGAKYDVGSKSWKLPAKELPASIQSTLAIRRQMDSSLSSNALSIVDNVDIEALLSGGNIQPSYMKAISGMSKDINKSIGLKIALTEEQLEALSKEWTENLDLYIKDFMQDNILKLRQEITRNTGSGQRAENLVEAIRSQFNVTKSKAQFLARQETSLLMSKMRETRYKSAGLVKYRWLTSNDSRVRSRHASLNNKIIYWDSPPVVDDKGNTAHAGEDFNCRCVAAPVIEG